MGNIFRRGNEYSPYGQHSGHTPGEFRGYSLQGVPAGMVVDYMTKRKDKI